MTWIIPLASLIAIGLVVAINHFLFGTPTARIGNPALALDQLQRDFPALTPQDILISDDQRVALFHGEDGSLGLLISHGEKFITRYYSTILPDIAYTDAGLNFRIPGDTVDGLLLKVTDLAARQFWQDRIPGTNP